MSGLLIVNGVQVFSDKQMSSIVDARVTFADGSWCDVGTGQIVNAGPGALSFSTPDGATIGTTGAGDASLPAQITSGPTVYEARDLLVEGLAAEVEIKIGRGPKMSVTLIGAQAAIDAIHVAVKERALVLTSDATQSAAGLVSGSSHGVVVSGSGNIVSMGDGSYASVSGLEVGGNPSGTKVVVEVPLGTAVSVNDVRGRVRVGNTEAAFIASVSGASKVTAGRVQSANLTVTGSGDIEVEEANGHVTMIVLGSGDVTIEGGQTAELRVSVTGSGDATFNGTARQANLTLVGSGDISVREIQERPVIKKSGSGDIKAGKW